MLTLVPRDSLIGMIIGPVLWVCYFVINYIISGTGCSLGYGDDQLLGMNAIRFLGLLAGAVTAILIVIACAQAESGRRRVKQDSDEKSVADRERYGFIFSTSLMLSGLALVGTLWLAMDALIAPIC